MNSQQGWALGLMFGLLLTVSVLLGCYLLHQDVYSYGIVVLELITGKNPAGLQMTEGSGTPEQGRLVTWVSEKMNGAAKTIEEIVDPLIAEECDKDELELLVKVALQCVEEDKEARPSMRQVVETLQ